MKTIKLLALLLISVGTLSGQNFEGKIIYKNEYKSKLANVTHDQLGSMMGTSQEYLIKGGNYKSSTNGNFFQWQLYIHADNKLYSKMSNSPVIYWNDGSINTDEVIKSEINKEVTNILGYTCDELVLTCKNGIQKYYFSSKLKVDPALFQKHEFGNWKIVMAKTSAIPLKMVIDNPQFNLVCLATEVVSMNLDEKIFELPAGSKVEKSPY